MAHRAQRPSCRHVQRACLSRNRERTQNSAAAPPLPPTPPPTPPPAQSKKPIIVTLKFVPSDSPLLRLPRELRDLVYWHTLVEPRKWDKRHVRTCPYYIPDAPAETPPYRIGEIDEGLHWIVPRRKIVCGAHGVEDFCYRKTCQEICLKRRGLELLRASKQINEEASPTFWKNLTVCFDDAQVLVTTLISLEDTARKRLKRLSLMLPQKIDGPQIGHDHEYRWSTSLEWQVRDAMLKNLGNLEALEDLELPAEYFEILRRRYVPFRSLRYLRCISSETIWYKSDGEPILLDVGLTRRFIAQGMGSHLCSFFGHYCEHCTDFFHGIADEGSQLTTATVNGGTMWHDAITTILARRQPYRAGRGPYILPLTLASGAKCQVKVWGLPANDPDTRARLECKEFLAMINRIPREHQTVKIIEDAVEADEKRLVPREDVDSRRQRRWTGQYKHLWTWTLRRRSEAKRRDVEHAAARRDKYESGGYEIVEDGCER